MKTGNEIEELQKFKREAAGILESAKFPVHKWESNVTEQESEGMPNPVKILGHTWDKKEDTLEINIQKPAEEKTVTKKTILSQLGSIYDPLGILSPTMAEGKRIYRGLRREEKMERRSIRFPSQGMVKLDKTTEERDIPKKHHPRTQCSHPPIC